MGDVFCALPPYTDGPIVAGKNAVRDPNEPQHLVHVPRRTGGGTLLCSEVTLPDVETHAAVVSQSVGTWGAEMGANEHGVFAAYSPAPLPAGEAPLSPALSGADITRLALERSRSAGEAVDVVVALLEEHGAATAVALLVADGGEAWVVEAVHRRWVAKQHKEGIIALTNGFAIGREWTRAAKGTTELDAPHAGAYAGAMADGIKRGARACKLLNLYKGSVDPGTVMAILRDIDVRAQSPTAGYFGSDICRHAGAGPWRKHQATGSFVSLLTKKGATHWATGTAAPDLSFFKPFWLDVVPDAIAKEPSTARTYDEDALWWRGELLHRRVMVDYTLRRELFRDVWLELQDAFVRKAVEIGPKGDTKKRREMARDAFVSCDKLAAEWTSQVTERAASKKSGASHIHNWAWARRNARAGMGALVEYPRLSMYHKTVGGIAVIYLIMLVAYLCIKGYAAMFWLD